MSFGTTARKFEVNNEKKYEVVTSDNLENPEYFRGPDPFSLGVDAEIRRKTVVDRTNDSVSEPISFSSDVMVDGLPHAVIQSPVLDLKIMKRMDPKWFSDIPKESPVTRIDFYHQKRNSTEPDLRNPFTYNGFIRLFPRDPVVLIIQFRDNPIGPIFPPVGMQATDREVIYILDNIKKALKQR